jgi:hypothetical protein
LPDHHPGSNFKWNASASHVNGEAKEAEQAATNGVKSDIAGKTPTVNGHQATEVDTVS